ncbi:MAG: hypothetical protein A2X64_06340 [Ignavibacteria bacterium GWF2_33_9]|nr:MAG: hypothetical protein A2X64_06340 [Ignavibacteria bacterium GWF2_33_9]
MRPKQLFEELIEIAKSNGYAVRKDTGNFRSNNCVLKDEKIIILNKFSTIESHNRTLAYAINQLLDNANYIKPAIREYLQEEAEKPLLTEQDEIVLKKDE